MSALRWKPRLQWTSDVLTTVRNRGAHARLPIVSKITEIADYQKSEVLTRKAWMVKEQFLKQYGILEPAIPNNWEYLLEQPMKKVTVSTPSTPTVNNQRFVDCERIQTLFLVIFEIIFHGFILFIDWGNSILFCKFDKLANLRVFLELTIFWRNWIGI